MFQDLSATEILTIAVVALIVIGPRHLPGIARRIGRYLGEIKRVAAGFRDDLEREVGPIKEPLQDLKETGREVSRPLGDVRKSLDEAAVAAKRPTDKRGGEEGAGPAEGGKGDGPAVRWVGPEPKTGVPPDQAWEGLNDPVPEGMAVPPPPPPPGSAPVPPPPVPPAGSVGIADPAPNAPSDGSAPSGPTVSPSAGSAEHPPPPPSPPARSGETTPSAEEGESGAAR